MPERGYFDLRTLVPGYSFIIMVFAIIFLPIFSNLQISDMPSIIGAIVALIGGPTLGFLVSQVWYWRFHWKIELYDMKPVQELISKYKLTTNETAQDKKKVLIVYDYVLHSCIHSSEKQKGLSAYAFRRWDIFILLSTTELSLVLGATIGIIGRVLSEIFLFNCSCANEFVHNPLFFVYKSEFWILTLIIVGAILEIGFIRHGKDWVKNEYECIHEIMIKTSAIKQKELRKLFPEDYFQRES